MEYYWLRAVHRFASRWRAYGRSVLACVVMWSNYFHSIDKINSALKSAVCSFGSFGLSLRSSSSLLASPRFLADKKAPVIGFFSYLSVSNTQKDLCQRCVTRANKNYIPLWWLDLKQKFLLNAKIWFSTDVSIIQINYVLCQYFIILKVLFSKMHSFLIVHFKKFRIISDISFNIPI